MDFSNLGDGGDQTEDVISMVDDDENTTITAVPVRAKKKRITLTPELFASRLGEVTRFKVHARKGKEAEDARYLLRQYENWCKRVFPSLSFGNFVTKGLNSFYFCGGSGEILWLSKRGKKFISLKKGKRKYCRSNSPFLHS